MTADLQQALYLIADEMRSIATIEGHYARDHYQSEHADRIMRLAAQIGGLAEEAPAARIEQIFREQPWFRATPALAVEAVVFDPDGRLLLIRRADDGLWALPAGFAEVGQTPAECVLKELWEEAGLRGQVRRLLGVLDSREWETKARIYMVRLMFLVECRDLDASPGAETLETSFFAADETPACLHQGQEMLIPKAFELARTTETFFDPACSYDVEMPMYQRAGKHSVG